MDKREDLQDARRGDATTSHANDNRSEFEGQSLSTRVLEDSHGTHQVAAVQVTGEPLTWQAVLRHSTREREAGHDGYACRYGGDGYKSRVAGLGRYWDQQGTPPFRQLSVS